MWQADDVSFTAKRQEYEGLFLLQELSVLEYSLVHRPAPIKAAAALLSAVSFQTKALRPYLGEMEVHIRICSQTLVTKVAQSEMWQAHVAAQAMALHGRQSGHQICLKDVITL